MTEPALSIPSDELDKLQAHIADTVTTGVDIRKILSTYSGTYPYDEAWEVSAAVMALRVFASRWTIEILSALYITGPKRFNELKGLLVGISSRTLSDKLTLLAREGLVIRKVKEEPPIRVNYILSEHGLLCGRLLSPLVAYLKLHCGAVISKATK
jgi:DNA-binding HxlR family transcriptional regulator